MYKQCPNHMNKPAPSVIRLLDGACIPFDPSNTDYQRFKVDLASGAVLNNADGSAMTAEQITEFLQGLD